jgi:hypothetical protein
MFHTEDEENIEKHIYGRVSKATDGITRLMRFACWVTKTTGTLTIRNTYCYSTATMVARMRFYVTLNVTALLCYYLL